MWLSLSDNSRPSFITHYISPGIDVMLCGFGNRILVHRRGLKFLREKSKLSYLHNVGSQPLKPLTLGLLLEDSAGKFGDTCAIISRHQNKQLTYSDVLYEADKLAAGLASTGLQNGDRVGIWAQNLVEWYIAFFACARAGYLTVAINPGYQHKELEYSVNKLGIKSIICGHKFRKQDYYETLTRIYPELPDSEPDKLRSRKLPSLKSIVTICDEPLRGTFNYYELLNMANDTNVELIKKNQRDIGIDDPANIQLTSGTTGHPKAAAVSHFGITNNGYYVGKRNELNTKHHKICVQVPLFHAFGTVITISASMNHGSTLVLPSEGFDPNKSLDALRDEKCTVIHGTPTMYVDLVRVQKERKEKIFPEIAVAGGSPCSPSLFKEMLSVLGVKKVKSVYGLSETTAVLFQSMPNDDEYKSTCTVGHIQEHVEAKVVDENDKIVPVGTPGELCVRTYSNMLGYWGEDDKTKEIMGADKWLHTGDQFIMEENGYGRIVGRLKEMIIRGGENIFPKEIEDYLNTHPHILESYVIGIPHERLGEEVCACVRVAEGHTITLEEIVTFCKNNISHFKIPSVLKVVPDIPKTLSGKVQKFKLLEQVLSE